MSTNSKPRGVVKTIARISQGCSCEFRVLLSTWRGETKIEFANFTSVIADIYFQAGVGLTLPIEKLDELIGALLDAKRRRLR